MRGMIIGGDDRFPELFRLFRAAGHELYPLAMEKVLPAERRPDCARAELVILPLPAERGGWLNAPLSDKKHKLSEFLEDLPPGTLVFAGMPGEELGRFCADRGLVLKDYFSSEELQIKNALLTVEGAIGLMLSADGRCLCGRKVLISGFGRIASLLAPRLLALGMDVTVAARSPSDRARAKAMGCGGAKMCECGGAWDFVVNTVPARVFGKEEISAFGEAILIELASAPYGFDMEAAAQLGKSITLAPGLPSLWAPLSAAEAIRDCILRAIMEE